MKNTVGFYKAFYSPPPNTHTLWGGRTCLPTVHLGGWLITPGRGSSQVAQYQLLLVMEQGSHIVHTAPLRLCWEPSMFTTGSPPFSTMGACYRYNPRYGQSLSVPKVWKCRHRRSVTPEEGKLGSMTLHLSLSGEIGLGLELRWSELENPLY